MSPEAPLLEPADRELLRRLTFQTRRASAGQATGEQRSPALGGGIEFADYREYVPGDDLRQVDWAVFLRLRKLLVKLCAEERELTVRILLDESGSMAAGTPDKFRLARRLAAVLAGIALHGGNRAGVLGWGPALTERCPVVRGGRAVPEVADRLRSLEARGIGHPLDCARSLAARYPDRCLVVLISDLLHPDWEGTLTGLRASGHETLVVHLLSPEELDPPQTGEVTLVDQETGIETTLLADAPLVDRYRTAAREWTHRVEAACRASGLGYAFLRSDEALPRFFLEDLRRAGLVC